MAAAPSEALFFQAHGLSQTTPAELNKALETALSSFPLGLPTQPSDVMSEAELAAFEDLGVDVNDAGNSSTDPVNAGVIAMASLIASALSVKETAERLQVTPSRISQLLGQRAMFGFRLDSRWHIPDFQFHGKQLIVHIAEVNEALPVDLHPVAVMRWYRQANSELVERDLKQAISPLRWLMEGRDPELLVQLAARLDETP